MTQRWKIGAGLLLLVAMAWLCWAILPTPPSQSDREIVREHFGNPSVNYVRPLTRLCQPLAYFDQAPYKVQCAMEVGAAAERLEDYTPLDIRVMSINCYNTMHISGGDACYNLDRKIPPAIAELTELTRISISRQRIAHVPPELGELTRLEELNLSFNRLTELPPDIGDLHRLQRLELWHNRLTTLPPEIGNLTRLEYLMLNENRLTELPPEISNLTSLRYLFLNDNDLTELPPDLAALPNLERLYIDGNCITKIPPEVERLIADDDWESTQCQVE